MGAEKSPLVTVLLSVYNGEQYLRQAVKSILSQTYRNYEFIAVNDGSNDATLDILMSVKDSRIKIIQNDQRQGLTRSLNRGFECSHGKYIARMDADDVSLPNRFKTQVDYMESCDQLAVIGTWALSIDSDGRQTGQICGSTHHDMLIGDFLFTNNLIHSSTLIRRSALKQVGGYDEWFKRSQDFDLWVRFVEAGYKLGNVPEILHKLRIHKNSISTYQGDSQETYAIIVLKVFYKRILGLYISIPRLTKLRSLMTKGRDVLNAFERLDLYVWLTSLPRIVRRRLGQSVAAHVQKRIKRLRSRIGIKQDILRVRNLLTNLINRIVGNATL